MVKPDATKGVWAVEYDHATKQEIHREDLMGMVVSAALTA